MATKAEPLSQPVDKSITADPTESLRGRDLCSTADLSPAEIRATLDLAHDVKVNP